MSLCVNPTSLQYYQWSFLLLFLPYTWIKVITNFCILVFNLICLNLYMPTKYIFIDQLNYWRVLRVAVTFWFWINLAILKLVNWSFEGQLHLNIYHCIINLIYLFIVSFFFFIIYLWILFYLRCHFCFVYKEGEIEESLF